MKKELILHVGVHKTATTSLQHFFYENKKWFEANDVGLFYYGLPGDVGYLTNGRDFFEGKKNAFLQYVKKSSCKRFILSEENNFSNLSLKNEHSICYHDIAPLFDVTLVIYVSRIDLISLKMWRYCVIRYLYKGSYKSLFDIGFFNYNYFSYIESVKSIMPIKRVIVRSFDKLYNNDIFQDFLQAIELPLEGYKPLSERKNVGVTLDCVFALQHLYRHYPGMRYNDFQSHDILKDCGFVNEIKRALEYSKLYPQPNNIHILSYNDRKNLFLSTLQDTICLEKKYNNGSPLFYDIDKSDIVYKRDLEQIQKVINFLLCK